MGVLVKIVPIAMLAFVVSSMLAVGLGLRVSEIVGPLRNRKLVLLALLSNFVLMPLFAIILGKVLRLDQPLAIGLLLLGSAAGAPFLPKLADVAKSNMGFAVGLMVVLMVLTVAYMPIVLPLVLKGVDVDALKIAKSLVLLMLLPLGVGLFVKARFDKAAAVLRKPLNRISSLSLIALIALQLITNAKNVVSLFGTRGLLASLLLLLGGVAIGFFMGGSDPATRSVLSLGTAQRNIAAAMVVAGQNFDDPRVLVIVVVVALVGLVVLMPLARMFGARSIVQLGEPLEESPR